jgi:hypothetical protein
MLEARLVSAAQRTARPNDPLESVDDIRKMLKLGQRVTKTGDAPVLYLPYHVDHYDVESNGTEVPCMLVAIPLNLALGDLRIKPKQWDDTQNKWKSPTLGITINGTCPEPPTFQFKDSDGELVKLMAKKNITLNIGLIDAPTEG